MGHEEEEEEAYYEDEDGEGDEGEANNGDEEMEQLEEEYRILSTRKCKTVICLSHLVVHLILCVITLKHIDF